MIAFDRVSKSFKDKKALDSVSIEVQKGTSCGYIGPNGAGKTTTAKIIVGLEQADTGKVFVNGKDASTQVSDIRRQVGFVPESPVLYESLTPIEVIAMASMLRKADKKRSIERLHMLSGIFHFGEFLSKPVRNLSKGTRQKVTISLALIFDPDVLILDEPTDGLDVQAVVALKQIIRTFTSHGGTVFYSSHLLDIVESVCDKVYFINCGHIAAEFSSERFAENRGFLENTFIENMATNDSLSLINAFFEDAE